MFTYYAFFLPRMLDIGLGLDPKLVFARFVPNIFLCVDYCPIINKNTDDELISFALSDVKVTKNLREVSCIFT